MSELIGIAVLIGSLYGGTLFAERIYDEVRVAALTKSAKGLPHLSGFAGALTKPNKTATNKITLQRKDSRTKQKKRVAP